MTKNNSVVAIYKSHAEAEAAVKELQQSGFDMKKLLPTDIEGFDSLAELALDLRWSWNHAPTKCGGSLIPTLWELTQNPWVVLQTVSRDKLERVLADPAFRKNVDDLLQAKRQAAEARRGFSNIIRRLL
jgi:hypothetical protein